MKKQIIISVFYLILANIIFGQNMQITWQQCIGGSNDEIPKYILSIEEGYFIVGGTYSNDGDISFNHGSSDAWIVKTDSIGNILWEKTFGGSNGEYWRRIFPAPGNCYYLLGASGSWDGDISYDPYPGSNDWWLAKIDSIGNLLWEKIIGGEMIDAIHSGTLTSDGGFVAFGYTGSQSGDISINYGMYDMWLVKLDSNGNIEWDKSFGTDGFDWGIDIIQTSDNGFLIGGSATSGNGGNITCEPYNNNSEAIVIKLDSIGNIEWQQCYGGSEHDGIHALLELEDGYVFSAYGESADGDLTGSGWHGGADIWVVKTDIFGNIIWQKCYGGSRYESALNIFKTEDNGLVLIGSTESNNGDVSGNHTLSEYDNDIWFLKIDSIGDIITQKCFGGEGNEFLYTGVAKKSDNNYVIAAYTNYGPSYDVACTPHGGNGVDRDFWVFEIKDCTQYPVGNIQAINGPDTVCTVYDSTNLYTISPVTGAWEYGWRLVPEGAGTINGNGLTATVNWATGWEGTAEIAARALNDCDTSEWSQPHYTEVFTCLGLEELRAGDVRMKVYPNPAKDYVVFELPTALINNAAIPNNAVIPNNGVIPNRGAGQGAGRRNPPTATGHAGKPQGNGSARNSKGVSHSGAQSHPNGFDMTTKEIAVEVIVNVFGQKVAQLPVTSEKTIWHTGNVENGIYFYRVEIEGEVLSGKVVVRK